VEALFGLPIERLQEADERLRQLGLHHIERELLDRTDADTVIGAAFLSESIEKLVDHGVEETRLLSKLRKDPDVWPTWAEIRAAAVLADHAPDGMRLVFEPERAGGKHSDYAFVGEDGERASVEFKALGLSDGEAAFCAAMAPAVAQFFPRPGLVTIHAPTDSHRLNTNRAERREMERTASRLATNLPVAAFHRISGSIATARGAEEGYLVRVGQRLAEGIDQLPPDEPGYVAFHWTNSAASWQVRDALAAMDLPDNLAGVMLVGSLAVPGSLHNFVHLLPAPFPKSGSGEIEMRSETPDAAQILLEVAELAAGVRAMVVRVPTPGGWGEFLVRDGQRRILPYNIIWDRDPPHAHNRARPEDLTWTIPEPSDAG
jgi:hypothetical protein